MLKALTNTSVELQLNGHWVIEVEVLDDYGVIPSVDPTVTVTSTSPTGVVTAPVATKIYAGVYRATVTVSTAGRYVVTVDAGVYGTTAFAAYVTSVTTAAQFPVLADVKTYLVLPSNTSFTDAVLQDALDSEAAAQRKYCDVPAIYPADLKQALLRRVARNLAMRKQPLATLIGDAESGSLVLPRFDPEIRRLEGPYRKVVLL